jgi:hypothetical protein
MPDLPATTPTIAKLQTHNLFIDTSIFRSKAFDLGNEALKKLGNLAHEEKIYLYSTFITEGEIKNNLLEAVNESLTKPEKLNLHLRNAGLSEIDSKKFREARIARWLEFTTRSNITLIPVPDDSIQKVFDLYFNSKPPFHDEKRKRYEFPDAFTIAALISWCEETEERMYVAVHDDLFTEACKETPLIPLTKIEDFLDLYNRHLEFPYQLARASFDRLMKDIKRDVDETIEGLGYHITYLPECDVADFAVKDIVFHAPLVIEATEEMSIINVDADINVSAYVTYSDPDFEVYDHETKQVFSYGDISEQVNGSISVTASIHIYFDETGDPERSELGDVDVPKSIVFRAIGEDSGDKYEVVSFWSR